MDAKKLSSWRREDTGMNRPPPGPQSCLCLLSVTTEASRLMEISLETFPWGRWPRKHTCMHTHTHALLSIRQEIKLCKIYPPGPWGNISATHNMFKLEENLAGLRSCATSQSQAQAPASPTFPHPDLGSECSSGAVFCPGCTLLNFHSFA
jgi:hypothetical protein